MIVDQDLRMVLWSRGMADVASGFEPQAGDHISTISFVSDHHRTALVASLTGLINGKMAQSPLMALHTALHTKANAVFHFATPPNAGVHAEVVLRVSAVKAWVPSQENTPSKCHVLVMGKEQVDPQLATLWDTADAISDLTSDTGSHLGSNFGSDYGQAAHGMASGALRNLATANPLVAGAEIPEEEEAASLALSRSEGLTPSESGSLSEVHSQSNSQTQSLDDDQKSTAEWTWGYESADGTEFSSDQAPTVDGDGDGDGGGDGDGVGDGSGGSVGDGGRGKSEGAAASSAQVRGTLVALTEHTVARVQA